MITGVRLSQLAIGEPLLGASWEYKTLTGKAAVIKRLEDLFYNAKYMGFNFIIDTIKPQIDANGKLTLINNGVHGDIWTFQERINKYKELCESTGMTLLLEVDFPNIDSTNVYNYAEFFIDSLISKYDWVKYWQVMVLPDSIDINKNYKCSPVNYTRFMSTIYPKVKQYNSQIQIGGPGIFDCISDYINKKEGWFAEAIGEYYDVSSDYTEIGDKGFLPYIDFFAFQGKQNTGTISYTNYSSIIDNLKESIYNRIGDNNIRFFSTEQGWKSTADDAQSLKQQGYYEIREILNAVRYGVVPFKDELIDEYPESDIYGSNFDSDRLNRGIFYWYLSGKPVLEEYTFILQMLSEFSDVTTTTKVMDADDSLDSFTLTKTDSTGETTATVIWPKDFKTATVTLLAAYNREYQIQDGERKVLNDATQVVLKDSHFLIVYEKVQKITIDVEDLEKLITRKLNYTEETLTNLLELLPSSYNKEVRDVNYYKLLRSLALEMGDAKVELDMIKDDLYLETARKKAIYDNFGILVNLKKRAEWDWEKYRRLVKGVTQSLLEGPTVKSIVNALQLFTNFNVNITELYKDTTNIDSNLLAGINPQYAFIVEIEKPLENKETQTSVYSDTNYIINIVKPAHTISIIVVTLSGKENWQDEYKTKHGIEWKNMDSQPGTLSRDDSHTITEGIYGWKHLGYNGVMKTANGEAISNSPLTNGGMLLGPRYVLYDQEWSDSNLTSSDKTKPVLETIASLLDLDEKELYDKAKANLSEIETYEEEMKFGFDGDDMFRFNGGMDGLSILNQYRLAFSSKLKDNVIFEPEYFFNDKYVFRNTLRGIQFNKHGFLGKFVNPPDKAIIFDFSLPELSFRKKIIRLNDGTETIIDRLEDIVNEIDAELQTLYDTANIGDKGSFIFEKTFNEDDIFNNDTIYPFMLNSSPLNTEELGFRCFRSHYEAELIKHEEYKPVQEEIDIINDWNNREYYRTMELTDPIYHIHKRVTSIMSPGQNYITVDPHDLYTNGNYDGDSYRESLARVFVNGMLINSWGYTELTSDLDPNSSYGVRFIDGIVYPGDIVSILYLNDRNIIIGNFPIEDDSLLHLEKQCDENYIVYNKVDNHFELNMDYQDKYKKVIDDIIQSMEYLLADNFHKVLDMPEFEGSPYLDMLELAKHDNQLLGFTLNKSFINKAYLTVIPIDYNCYEMRTVEDINIISKLDFLEGNIIEQTFTELKPVILDVPEFEGPAYLENNILNISDNSEFGMQPSEQWKNKVDIYSLNIADILIRDKFIFKEDKFYQDYISGVYADKLELNISDSSENEQIVYDEINKNIIDRHIQNTECLNIDDVNILSKSDSLNSAAIFSVNTDLLNLVIKDHHYNSTEFSDIRKKKIADMTGVTFWSILNKDNYITKKISSEIELSPSERKDNRRITSNIQTAFRFLRGQLGLNKFITKNVLDYENYGIYTSEELDKSNILVNQTDIDDYVSENPYEIESVDLLAEYSKPNIDIYNKKSEDAHIKKSENDCDENYNLKAAICYMELVKYYDGKVVRKIKQGSMT